MTDESNLECWRRYGDHVLVVQPFMDNVIVRGEGNYLIDREGQSQEEIRADRLADAIVRADPQVWPAYISAPAEQLASAREILSAPLPTRLGYLRI